MCASEALVFRSLRIKVTEANILMRVEQTSRRTLDEFLNVYVPANSFLEL